MFLLLLIFIFFYSVNLFWNNLFKNIGYYNNGWNEYSYAGRRKKKFFCGIIDPETGIKLRTSPD